MAEVNKKVVGIDARFAFSSERRGIGNYSRSVIDRLNQLDTPYEIILYIDRSSIISDFVPKNCIIKRIPFSSYLLWEQLGLPVRLWLDNVDVIHSHGNTAPILLPKACSLLLTLHDTIFATRGIFGGYSSFYQFFGELYRRINVYLVGFKARKILTISEFSRREIIRNYPNIESRRLAVHYLCCSSSFESAREELNDKDNLRYGARILTLGAKDTRKNTELVVGVVLEAMASSLFDGELFVVGYSRYQESAIFSKVANSRYADRIHFCGYVTEEELISHYRQADVFVFGSRLEGFGIPVLEALNVGCPVICSSASSMPEVGGESVYYFDPMSEKSLLEALSTVLGDASLRCDMVRMGRLRAKEFSWDHCVDVIHDHYVELLH